jgi:hypothetical protein
VLFVAWWWCWLPACARVRACTHTCLRVRMRTCVPARAYVCVREEQSFVHPMALLAACARIFPGQRCHTGHLTSPPPVNLNVSRGSGVRVRACLLPPVCVHAYMLECVPAFLYAVGLARGLAWAVMVSTGPAWGPA